MLNTHFANIVKSYAPMIEQLTNSYAFIIPTTDDKNNFGVDIELTDGTGNREIYSLYIEDDKICVSTNADVYSYHSKIMNDIVESILQKLSPKIFTREDYFERIGLPRDLDVSGWDKIKGLSFTEEKNDKPRIYFDMDGVLAVFNKNATMEEVFSEGYFRSLTPIKEMVEFAKSLQENGYDIHILSGACFSAVKEKIEWLQEHMPFISAENITFVPVDADKSAFIPDPVHSVLIDDYNKNLNEWQGLAIKCKTDINNHNPKYMSIDIHDSLHSNLERFMDKVEEWTPRSGLSLGDYLTITYTDKESTQMRPRVVCNDGFSFFVTVGKDAYCAPKMQLQKGSEYSEVQIDFPSKPDTVLSDFANEYLYIPKEDITESNIPHVPMELAEKMVKAHGGISPQKSLKVYDLMELHIVEKYTTSEFNDKISKESMEALSCFDAGYQYPKMSSRIMEIAYAVNDLVSGLADYLPDFVVEDANSLFIDCVNAGNEEEGAWQKVKQKVENICDVVRHFPLDEKHIMLADIAQHRVEQAEKFESELEKDERDDKSRD